MLNNDGSTPLRQVQVLVIHVFEFCVPQKILWTIFEPHTM